MTRYIIRRILLAALALIILTILIFFLMQAIPGYPLKKEQNWTTEYYYQMLRSKGLLDNPVIQLFKFIAGIFTKGRFGVVYNSDGQTVVQKTLVPIQYTIMVAGPAFILSSILGITLGIVAARYRGTLVDTCVNILAVLFLAVPSFIFALYLVKLAGVIGLPTQFIAPGNGTPGQQALSLIMPIAAMTLSSISAIFYYTRNELVDIFKQDYIKTALAKGISFTKIIFTHALRNAMIPVLACLLPSFMGILTGSIIIEKFFNIPGSSTILISAIQDKEIYIVMFSTMFYSGIYFALQIAVDISYTYIDPRIKLAASKNISIFKKIKSKLDYQKSKENTLHPTPVMVQAHADKVSQMQKEYELELLESEKADEELKSELISKEAIQMSLQQIPVQTLVAQDYSVSTYIQKSIKPNYFKPIKNYSFNNEQIVGKKSTYIKDVVKRFAKSKVAIIFTIILAAIILMAFIIPLATPNSTNESIGHLSSTIVGYLPPRAPFVGLTGIVSQRIVTQEVYNVLLDIKEHTPGCEHLFASATQQGSSWVLKDYNPYVLPALRNVYPIMGTDGVGRNWWDLMWYATAKSLIVSIIAAAGSVIIGTIYGSIAGSFAGKAPDTIMMRIIEIISGVPLIVWVLIISVAVSGGSLDIFTICLTLIITTWMGSAIIARTYVIKYKDSEFVQAAKTLGASQIRIIFSHLIPNIVGRLLVVFVNRIPVIIFFETSLVFLGLQSSGSVSLGTMINTAWLEVYPWLLVGPALTLVLTTLSSIIIANNLNDAIDPKISA
ncbi:ABC transporter permease subunit [Ureaplasma ceti]